MRKKISWAFSSSLVTATSSASRTGSSMCHAAGCAYMNNVNKGVRYRATHKLNETCGVLMSALFRPPLAASNFMIRLATTCFTTLNSRHGQGFRSAIEWGGFLGLPVPGHSDAKLIRPRVNDHNTKTPLV